LTYPLPAKYFTHKSSYPWFVVGTVCIGAFMAALDASIINVALPTLLTHFRGGMHRIEWVSVSYLLTLTALLTVFGRVADMVGRRFMYTTGFLVFIIGSLFCGLATHLPYLILARILQAAGAAMLQANSVAIITGSIPATKRGKAIGIQGTAQAMGLLLGPALGGVLLTYFGWQSIFYINIPIGIIGSIAGLLILPKDEKPRKQNFDYIGALTLSLSLVMLLLVLTDGTSIGWLSSEILTYGGLFILLFTTFILWERKVKQPIIDFALFKIGTFTIGNLTGLLSFSIMYGVLFLTPFYYEHVQQLMPSSIGFILTAVPIAMAIITPLSGFFSDRYHHRKLTFFGMSFSAVGTLLLGFTLTEHSTYTFILSLLLIGAGQGIFTPPNNSSVMGSAPRDRLGISGGILNMSRSLGMSFGIAFAGAVYQLSLNLSTKPLSSPSTTEMLHAFRIAFLSIGVLGVLALLIIYLNSLRVTRN